jgi:hypothetical protein
VIIALALALVLVLEITAVGSLGERRIYFRQCSNRNRENASMKKLMICWWIGFVCAVVSAQDHLLFIHHSCGQNWLDHSLRDALAAKAVIGDVHEITYGIDVAADAGRPDSLAETPGESTDMQHWVRWFNDYRAGMSAHGCAAGFNRVVMFKSCYPNSHVDEDGVEPGNPFDGTRSLANYRAVYRHPDGPGNAYDDGGVAYFALEDIFAAHPDTLFIPVTAPPECYADATLAAAARARAFNEWLTGTWLPGYEARTGLHNVAVYDWFDLLANADDSGSHANMLRTGYGGATGDSHPNDTANGDSTVAFATGAPNFFDAAWAAFAADLPEYRLTMAVDPPAGGTTLPAAGTHSVTASQAIVAQPSAGYRFDAWTASGAAVIADVADPTTGVTLSGDAAVTATFVLIPANATLTVAVDPVDGGATTPAVGDHVVATEVPISLRAEAAVGHVFLSWATTGHATVADADAISTTVTLLDAGSVTARFVVAPWVACGSTFILSPADLTDFAGDAFIRKPKVTATYADPFSGRAKRAATKVRHTELEPASAIVEWTKRVKLFDRRAIPVGVDSATWLGDNAVLPLVVDLAVATPDENGARGPFVAGQAVLRPPVADHVEDHPAGTPIVEAAPGAVVLIVGEWFGARTPSVWIEYASGGRVKSRKCKVRKDLFTNVTAAGKPSCMNHETGTSVLPVALPAIPPENRFGHLVIDNAVGRTTVPLALVE